MSSVRDLRALAALVYGASESDLMLSFGDRDARVERLGEKLHSVTRHDVEPEAALADSLATKAYEVAVDADASARFFAEQSTLAERRALRLRLLAASIGGTGDEAPPSLPEPAEREVDTTADANRLRRALMGLLAFVDGADPQRFSADPQWCPGCGAMNHPEHHAPRCPVWVALLAVSGEDGGA